MFNESDKGHLLADYSEPIEIATAVTPIYLSHHPIRDYNLEISAEQ